MVLNSQADMQKDDTKIASIPNSRDCDPKAWINHMSPKWSLRYVKDLASTWTKQK